MRRPRPYIPLSVRIKVIQRQLHAAGKYAMRAEAGPLGWVLSSNLRLMFGEPAKLHLDHCPALILRDYDDFTATYDPPANDPNHLTYRTENDHRLKTYVRGPGAQRSDTSERRYQKRVAENRGLRKRRPKAKIVSRSNWPKGQKLRSRPFPQSRQ